MTTRRFFLALPILGARMRLWAQTDLSQQYHFESSPWPNLHHFLYVLARARNGAPDRLRVAVREAPLDNRGFDALPAEDRKAWDAAISIYQKDAAPLEIGYGNLVDVNYAVADLDGWAPLGRASDIPESIGAALEEAGPVYRKLWWARHDDANRAWIRQLQPQVAQYGPRIATQLSAAFRRSWPTDPLRVEVVAYASWGGAYTTPDPPLIAMSSLNEEHRGADGLEQLFHETSHLMMDTVDASLESHTRALGKDLSRDVSHAILFYTVGEVVSRIVPDHVSYADHYGVWQRGLGHYHDLAVQHWQPYLEGKIDMDEAIDRIVRGI
jgi:hypothetical protein